MAMKISVRLFGTLPQYVSRYDHAKGVEIELPDNADVAELLARLAIPKPGVGMVSVDGRLVRADEKLAAGDSVHLFQPLFGG
jgi:sulfur carrier protein ThiS